MNLEQFEATIERIPFSGCWIWMRKLSEKGYAKWFNQYAHRMAYALYRGQITGALCVCHSCDVRCCVNPAHLFLGTRGDNNRDMHLKGRGRGNPDGSRGRVQAGTANYNAKLSLEQVIAIRASTKPQEAIAAEFGVSQTQISRIRTRQQWL